MGFEFSKPNLGSAFAVPKAWTGFNIIADIAEIKFGFGRVDFSQNEFGVWGGPVITEEMHAKYMSFGVNLPLKFGAIGFQGSSASWRLSEESAENKYLVSSGIWSPNR